MRPELLAFKNKVEGMRVFILGGGPSVLDINKKHLENELIVGINKAYEYTEKLIALYWCDQEWATQNLEHINRLNCLKITGLHGGHNLIKNNLKTIGGALALQRTGDYGIDTDIDHVRGNNSGAHVINFLANNKVSEIVLLGFDGKLQNNRSHWHAGYNLPMSNHIYNDIFIPSINSMAAPLKNLGIKVTNLSLNSEIKCFEIKDWREYFES